MMHQPITDCVTTNHGLT